MQVQFDAIKNELKTRTTGGDFNIVESFDYDDNNRLVNWTNPVTGIKPTANRNVYDVKGRILNNDQVGTMKFENSAKIYQPTGMTLNSQGSQNYNGDLIQTVTYNENNDPVMISGEKTRVGFDYGLGSMRQRVNIIKLKQFGTGGGEGDPSDSRIASANDLLPPVWQNVSAKFYNEDNSFEIVANQTTGQEKHVIYIEGSPYEANIVYLKEFGETNGSYKFLHKDYIGSILAISDEAGNKVEQRHFDAWGNFTHLQIGNNSVTTDKNVITAATLLVDRGYTSHEHFMDVGIIHMNGRLYDPLLRRFLNADENIQEPTNTQNYNKYGYVMNNPLIYNDPNGEWITWLIGAVVGSYISGVQANHGNMNPFKWDWKNTWSSVLGGGLAGAAIGGAIQNINGVKFMENSVAGTVGGIFNGLSSGQNVFKSALTGFSGISSSFNISGNSMASTDSMIDSGYSSAAENFESAFYNIRYPSNLENEMWLAGLNPYDRNVFGRSDELMQKVGSIKKLANAITSRKGVLEVIDVFKTEDAGNTSHRNFRISLNVNTLNNSNLLGYGYTLSHELIHSFDLQFNMEDWSRNYGSSGFKARDLQAWREKRSYDYNMRQGMKLEGAQIEFYRKQVEIIKNSKGLQDNLRYFKIINPWK